MPTISIITPWSGNTAADLLPDYANATQGAEIITVDNACAPETASALESFHAQVCGRYIRNESNLGFAGGNNQGYTLATGHIVLFLNSDIAAPPGWLRMVEADVKHGALYGPSMQQQLVAGRWLPYIEGWCIAATRATWEALRIRPTDPPPKGYEGVTIVMEWGGPWDADAYPSPYWEDNGLCLQALQQGIQLVQTAWPVQHKGGRTAGAIAKHGMGFEQNRATFVQRVLAAVEQLNGTTLGPTYARYVQHCMTQSDIQHHLPLLYSLAKGNVLELGTRTGVSTAALLAGVEARGGHVWSIDTDPRCQDVAAGHPQWTFVHASSTEPAIADAFGAVDPGLNNEIVLDMLFIDTEHTYEQASAELALWAPHVKTGGHILLHDPETFPGVRRAVTEFCAARGWPVTFVLPCNGMAVIEVPS